MLPKPQCEAMTSSVAGEWLAKTVKMEKYIYILVNIEDTGKI